MIRVQVTTTGDSAAIQFPRQILDKLKVEDGGTLLILETPDGILLRPYDPEFEKQMRLAEQITREYPDTLRELSK